MMRDIYMRFPGGRVKAVTLSYDDGVETDARLIDIMHKNGLKGTFNVNTGLYPPEGTVHPKGAFHRRMTHKQLVDLYTGSGMEVAVHTLNHPFLEELPAGLCVEEILEDRKNLERDFGSFVRGMAYPYGTYNDSVVETVRACGIVYARTVESSHQFTIPTDWLRLKPTCHHIDPMIMDLAREFVNQSQGMKPLLYYLWGHSYEFERDNNWELIEEFAAYVGNRSEIWYATNIEIYDYVKAYEQLIFTADGMTAYNPTNSLLWLQCRDTAFEIHPGEMVRIG